MIKKLKNNKAFTIIELIVVIAILGILVLLASPRFLGYTKDAQYAKGIANAKVLQDASQMYYIDHEDWPRLTDDPYTAEELETFSEKVYDITGKEVKFMTLQEKK
jgi:prepilin-type N-terminal cleavage/methylation domain-containing protein